MESTVEQIEKSFNTWSFKRRQPTNVVRLKEAIRNRVESVLPIEFSMYWGKGAREEIGNPEFAAFLFIEKMRKKIHELYEAGTRVHVIATDSHAELNGYSKNESDRYFLSVEKEMPKGWDMQHMSEVAKSDPTTNEIESVIPDSLMKLLTAASQKHGKKPLKKSPEVLAREYYDMNQGEKQAVAKEYPKSIFLTYNDHRWNPVLPTQLPIFYMHSIRKGVSEKPWFIGDGHAAAE